MSISCFDVKTLVFSGGGLRGAPLIAGALWRLNERISNWDLTSKRRKIDEVRGTSMGALAALYITCRVHPDDFVEDVMRFDHYSLIDWSAKNLLTKCGLCDCQAMVDYFEKFIFRKTGIRNATFKELCAWGGVRLVILACDINEGGKEFVMSGETTPAMNVANAVAASMSIPFFFVPQISGGKLLIDGGVVNHYPISGPAGICDPRHTIGFLCAGGADAPNADVPSVDAPKACPSSSLNPCAVAAPLGLHGSHDASSDKPTSTLKGLSLSWAWEYFEKLIAVLLNMLDRGQVMHRDKIKTVNLTPVTEKGVSLLNWDLSYDQRRMLLKRGIQGADDFLDTDPPSIVNSPPVTSSSTQTDNVLQDRPLKSE
jgi:predicted acylesterase/phospholipase RssA